MLLRVSGNKTRDAWNVVKLDMSPTRGKKPRSCPRSNTLWSVFGASGRLSTAGGRALPLIGRPPNVCRAAPMRRRGLGWWRPELREQLGLQLRPLIWMQICWSWGVGWRQALLSLLLPSCQQSHIMWETDRLELPRVSHWKPIWTTGCFWTASGKRCRGDTDIFTLRPSSLLFSPFFFSKSCTWDICWIRKAACITRDQWEDQASTCPHRTLFPLHSIPSSPDTIMCPTWIHTHSRRGAGGHRTVLPERTGAPTAWDHLTLSPPPWTTHLPDRFRTARPSTVTCTLRDPRCCSRRRKTFL